MQFTLIFLAIVAIATTHSYPATLTLVVPETTTTPKPARPVQQFFNRIWYALRPTTPTTTEAPRAPIRIPIRTPDLNKNEIQQTPTSYVDFSTFLLNSLRANNTIVGLSYLGLNDNVSNALGKEAIKADGLPGNFTVISFIVPHEKVEDETEAAQDRGILNFLQKIRRPFQKVDQPPAQDLVTPDTVYSNFPPFFEYFTQRLQAYFSTYKYPDGSRTNDTLLSSSSLSDENTSADANASPAVFIVKEPPIFPVISLLPGFADEIGLLGDEVETTTSCDGENCSEEEATTEDLAKLFDFDTTTTNGNEDEETTTDDVTENTDSTVQEDDEFYSTTLQFEEMLTGVADQKDEMKTTTDVDETPALCLSVACAIDDSTAHWGNVYDDKLETTTMTLKDFEEKNEYDNVIIASAL